MLRSLRRRSAFLLGAVVLAGMALWYFRSSSELTDLVYATADITPLTLDLDFPTPRPPQCPVILYAPPDGEWPRLMKRDPRCAMLFDKLTKHGYAVATVHYRLPGKYRFPAQVEDGKAAVRWLRTNAVRYGLDTRRIGVAGVSSGGYGACMLGTTDAKDGFEGEGGNPEQSSRVQAVVCLGVPADFTVKNWPRQLETVYLRPFLGASYEEDPERYERASPGAYASPDDPPFLLFHSTEDMVVPVEMARIFADRLLLSGVSVDLVEVHGLEHIWGGTKLERALEQMLEFFDRHLRPSEGARGVESGDR
jgi:acetyl esterase/lipase